MVIALGGCKSWTASEDLPAWITNPDSGSRAALQAAVNEALNTQVALADDALTNSSILTIQRNLADSLESEPAQGRNTDMPIQFRLVLSGGDCVLIELRNQSRRILPKRFEALSMWLLPPRRINSKSNHSNL